MEDVSNLIKRKTNIFKKKNNWLITGVAGFIGSNLLETLLKLNQSVIGLDNFSNGSKNNLNDVRSSILSSQWNNFKFIKGDINNLAHCNKVCKGSDYVLHQAAVGSVQRSIEDPIKTNLTNVNGFLNMLIAARDAKVKKFIYATSSSIYGDLKDQPRIERKIGNPLSPYAVSKLTNEYYANVFATNYNMKCIGLRYFNVFGKRQSPQTSYAAVIPKWINAIINNKTVYIYGDGKNSRDFCYINNVIFANLLAANTKVTKGMNQIFNIASGKKISLKELIINLKNLIFIHNPKNKKTKIKFVNFRKGDVKHSLASIKNAKKFLKYNPEYSFTKGLSDTVKWHIDKKF